MPASPTPPLVPAPPRPLPASIRARWLLDREIAFLNHGSFGATPIDVLDAQARLRDRIESRPIEMLGRRGRAMLDESRKTVAAFVGATPANLAFVTNATNGINCVLRSLEFSSGDELLSTNHVYNAVRQTMRYVASRSGARAVEVAVPLPLRSPQQVIDAIAGAITSRTRILVVDHVTSPTAVVFPLQRIIELCDERGVDVLVDGAHAPGMLELDIERLGPAYYAANLHKWVCAPKGSAFLWVRPDRQRGIHPTTVSHFLEEGFQAEFNWQGTLDITPWVCAATSIESLGAGIGAELAGNESDGEAGAGADAGWRRIRRRNHEMAVWVQAMLCDRWGVEPATPMDGSMLGSMATVPLPAQERLRTKFAKFDVLQAAIYERHQVEVPVVDWGGTWWVRPCCQLYNVAEDYERLAAAVTDLIR